MGDNSRVKPVDGKDLRLTIDRDVQWYSQRVLRQAVQSTQAKSGAAVVMDSRTGEVLAVADYPTYDPNKPGKAGKGLLTSKALGDVYEPGSVEKVLTASALMDAGKVSPRTKIKVPVELPVLDRIIGDWFDHGVLRLTMAGVIARSSNIGTALAAMKFTPEQLWSYLDKFGLGQRTGVGVPAETKGLLPPPSIWSTLTRAQVAFGQGLSVNVLQMAAAVNTLANGGERITPSLVKGQATTTDGDEVGTATTTRHRVVSPAAATKMSRMMELVTTPDIGTAPGAGIEGYRVAGKTGTAQEVGGKCNCYADGGIAVSFAGFAPADKPRFTVYVVVKNPADGASGGGTDGAGVPQDPQLRPPEVRRAADRDAAGRHAHQVGSGRRPDQSLASSGARAERRATARCEPSGSHPPELSAEDPARPGVCLDRREAQARGQ